MQINLLLKATDSFYIQVIFQWTIGSEVLSYIADVRPSPQYGTSRKEIVYIK